MQIHCIITVCTAVKSHGTSSASARYQPSVPYVPLKLYVYLHTNNRLHMHTADKNSSRQSERQASCSSKMAMSIQKHLALYIVRSV